MKKEEIQLEDIHRILFGQMPAEFFIEVIIRTAFIYLLLLVSMRLMGKRMASALSRTEQVAMVSLAAAVGMPLQSAERGLLPAVIIAAIVVFTERLISFRAYKNKKFETIAQDKLDTLVANGIVQTNILQRVKISRSRLLSQLRSEDIRQLGEVKRLYIEANGSFTLIKEKEPKAGLSILPEWDEELRATQIKTNQNVCKHCGSMQENNEVIYCRNCNSRNWECAVTQ